MKKLGIIALLLLALGGAAQVNYTNFYIRSFQQGVFVEMYSSVNLYQYSDYGNISRSNRADFSVSSKYLYQSQEYDSSLNLYFYPYRCYSPYKMRFNSPDPKSQYFSPYVFVGSDPINYSDFDGLEGVPLVIYGTSDETSVGMSDGIMDLRKQVPNAHYISLDEFVNRSYGPLPKLNGNVFFAGHTHAPDKGTFVLAHQKAPSASLLKHEVSVYPTESGLYSIEMSARKIGQTLRYFSLDNNVPIESVVVGGCEGKVAARSLAKGFRSAVSEREGKELKTFGLKRGRFSHLNHSNYKLLPNGKVEPIDDRMRFSVTNQREADYVFKDTPEGKTYRGLGIKNRDGEYSYATYAEGEELNGMVDCRIPECLQEDFVPYFVKY